MGPEVIGILGIAAVFALILMGVPIAFSLMGVGVLGLCLLSSPKAALPVAARTLYEVGASYPYMVIPLFVLMGEMASSAGMVGRLYEAFDRWFRGVPAGLGIATILSCAGFSAVSGSSVATAAAMATVAYPQMRRYGYDPRLATGSIAAGGTLGFLIPPSIGFVVYGMLTEQSVGKLLVAGILPGAILTGGYLAVVILWASFRPSAAPRAGGGVPWAERWRSLGRLWEVISAFLLVMGGIYLGFFTPTEAAAVGASYLFLLATLRGKIGWGELMGAFSKSMRVSVMVLVLVAGANVFSYFLALSTIPMELSLWASGLEVPRAVVLGLLVVLYLFLGCFLDAISMMVLTLPVVYPLVLQLGYDPLWFGVISVLMMEAGLITPPLGLNVYTVAGLAKVEAEEVFKGALPFLGAVLLVVLLLGLWPGIALYLPQTMFR